MRALTTLAVSNGRTTGTAFDSAVAAPLNKPGVVEESSRRDASKPRFKFETGCLYQYLRAYTVQSKLEIHYTPF